MEKKETKAFKAGDIVSFPVPSLYTDDNFRTPSIADVGRVIKVKENFLMVMSENITRWIAFDRAKMATKSEVIEYTLKSMMDEY